MRRHAWRCTRATVTAASERRAGPVGREHLGAAMVEAFELVLQFVEVLPSLQNLNLVALSLITLMLLDKRPLQKDL